MNLNNDLETYTNIYCNMYFISMNGGGIAQLVSHPPLMLGTRVRIQVEVEEEEEGDEYQVMCLNLETYTNIYCNMYFISMNGGGIAQLVSHPPLESGWGLDSSHPVHVSEGMRLPPVKLKLLHQLA